MRKFTLRASLTIVLLVGIIGSAATRTSMASEPPDTGESINLQDSDPHSKHRAILEEPKRYQLSKQHYSVPDVNLINMNGDLVSLRETLDQDKPVMLNFIFTSCTTICPVLTATMVQAEKQLLNDPVVPKIVSVSIDPEYDTPDKLRSYAAAYRAGADWDFLTGDTKSIIAVQRAFDSYRGGKANHIPIAFLRASGGDVWVRLDGFTTAADLVREFREITRK